MVNEINIREEYIKLDSALKLAGFVSTGGHAKTVIQNGEVRVNGEVCVLRGKKLYKGDRADYAGDLLIVNYEGK